MRRLALAIALGACAAACDGEIHLAAGDDGGAASGDAGDAATSLDASGDGASSSGAPAPAYAYGTCGTDADCALASLHCDGRGACVECRSDADCTSGERPRCDAPTSRCVGCRGDADCDAANRCELSTHACVRRCTAQEPCSRGTCDVASGLCVECTTDPQCGSELVCSSMGVCVGCTADASCHSSEEPRCDVLLGRCVTCTSNADCAAPARCDPVSGECKAP